MSGIKSLTYFKMALALILLLPVISIAQDADNKDKKTVDSSMVVVTVNDKKLTLGDFQLYLEARRMRSQAPLPDEKQLLEDFISRELVLQDARRKKLDKDMEFKHRVNLMSLSLLADFAVQKHLEGIPVTDEVALDLYNQNLKKQERPNEYKIRHILSNNEEHAKSIIKRLKEGQNFSELAKRASQDEGSARKGGSLGWVSTKNMEKAIFDMITTLKPGQYSETPVKTYYGWHVLLLEDVRGMEPIPFEDVKERLKEKIQAKVVMDYISQLRSSAVIKRSSP